MELTASKTLNLSHVEPRRRFKFSGNELLLLGFVILWALLLYNVPKAFSVVIQLIILGLFFKSKQNHYWIALYMCAGFHPGGLFHNLAPVSLSLFNAPGLGTITFGMGFSAVAILKALTVRKKAFYETYLIFFGLYIFFLYGIFGGSLTYFIKGILSYAWLIFMPKLIRDEEELYSLFRMIFVLNLAVFAMNIYQILTGLPFVHLLGGGSFASSQHADFNYLYTQRDTEELVRTAYGIQFAYLALSGSVYYLSKKRSDFPQASLYFFLVVAYLNVFLSATRGWILGASFMIIGYSMFMIPKLFRNISVVAPTVGIMLVFALQFAPIRNQIVKANERFMTTEAILQGDLSAGGTSRRMERGIPVLKKYMESPIIGWGFGPESSEYADGHTGHQTMLLQFGALGYLLYISFWLVFMFKPIIKSRKRYKTIKGAQAYLYPFFAFGGLIIIHSTSAMFLHPFMAGPMVATVLTVGNIVYGQVARGSLDKL